MAFSLQRRHLGFDPVCQCRNIVQVKICAGDIPHHRQRLEGDGRIEMALRTTSIFGQPLDLNPSSSTRS